MIIVPIDNVTEGMVLAKDVATTSARYYKTLLMKGTIITKDMISLLKGKGIKSVRSSRKGDLYVKVTLEVPTKLNHKQKKAIESMGKSVTSDCYQKKSSFLDSIKEFFS